MFCLHPARLSLAEPSLKLVKKAAICNNLSETQLR